MPMNQLKAHFVSAILYLFSRFLNLTWRYRYHHQAFAENSLKQGKPYIFALWHQQLSMSLFGYIGTPHVIVISPSFDGQIVSNVAEWLGNSVCRGSSSRGGMKALKGMIRFLAKGLPAAITVDGPKGPAKEVKEGIFQLAKLSSTPIVPLVCVPSRSWCLKKSWDRFLFPKPFATIHLLHGEPISVARDCVHFSELQKRLLDEMTRLEEEARQYFAAGVLPWE